MRIWMNTAQVAERVGVSRVTVMRALEAGVLHGGQAKPGGRWRVHVDCADAWALNEKCQHQRQAVRSA